MDLRRGDTDDLPALLDLFDEAVAWMVANGNTEQWGTEPWSARPEQVTRVRGVVEASDLWVAEIDGAVVGALIVSDQAQEYVPAAGEPELYVRLLISSRRHAGSGIGARLLDQARDEARARGVSLMRLDCYAGGDGSLVRYYTDAGFTPTSTFSLGDWPGQILEQRL